MIDAWYEGMGEKSDEVSDIREEELAKSYWSTISTYISNPEDLTFKSEKSSNEVLRDKGMDQILDITSDKGMGTRSNE